MIVRYSLVIIEALGLAKSAGWLYTSAAPPAVDQLAWRQVNRSVEQIPTDNPSQQPRWIPDASNLSNDQIPWRGLQRSIVYTFDEGGLAKTSGWTYPFQPVIDNLAWQKLARAVEYLFQDGGRANFGGYLFAPQQPPPPVNTVIRPVGSARPAGPVGTIVSGSPEGTIV